MSDDDDIIVWDKISRNKSNKVKKKDFPTETKNSSKK